MCAKADELYPAAAAATVLNYVTAYQMLHRMRRESCPAFDVQSVRMRGYTEREKQF